MSATLEERVTLNNISWGFYQSMRREIGDAHVRLTFDQGRLEIMSPSGFHEAIKTIIGRLIKAYADESGIVVEGMGSTTFSRDDLQRVWSRMSAITSLTQRRLSESRSLI